MSERNCGVENKRGIGGEGPVEGQDFEFCSKGNEKPAAG